MGAGTIGLGLFLRYEGRLTRRGGAPLFDVAVLRRPGVPSGLLAGCLVMGCYAGFLFTLTLRLQDGLGFSALAAGLAFLPYAGGFALCGLAVPRLPARLRDALPLVGPPVLAAVVAAVALLSRHDWPWPLGSALLAVGGAAHAAGFSPLVDRLAAALPASAAAAFSALVSTGTLLAAVLGVAVLGGLQLAFPGTPAAAALTAGLLLAAPVAAARCARALRPDGALPPPAGALPPPAGPAGPDRSPRGAGRAGAALPDR